MKALAFNASPRKSGNTATLLQKALDGAAQAGAQTELVHLYDYSFKGCVSCFACKRLGGKSYGRCAVRDAITPLLDTAAEADLLLLGSPIYLGTETGVGRAFMERLIYPYHTYAKDPLTLFPHTIRTVMVYTAGVPLKVFAERGYDSLIERTRRFMHKTYGHCEVLIYDNAKLFDDPAGYFCPAIDPEKKQRHHDREFPLACERAFALGKELASA